MIPNWEYKVIHLDEDELDVMENKLNNLGKEGWELVSWDSETGIFKRRQLYFLNPYDLDKEQPEISESKFGWRR